MKVDRICRCGECVDVSNIHRICRYVDMKRIWRDLFECSREGSKRRKRPLDMHLCIQPSMRAKRSLYIQRDLYTFKERVHRDEKDL